MKLTNRFSPVALSLALFLMTLSGVVRSEALPADKLRQQQRVQQQVHDMAERLAAEVLDLQLQQLRENNLVAHPYYVEIARMRDHLDELVTNEMSDVIALLEEADVDDEAARVKIFQDAREKSRLIVTQLLAEQQILLRRLKIAELARQVQQLIVQQTKTMTSTQNLLKQPESSRAELNLATLEDQRDVGLTCGQFEKNLRDAVQLAGTIGQDAAEALKICEQERLSKRLVDAEASLRSADFQPATLEQKGVIGVLQSMLAKIQRLQKSIDGSASELENKIAEALAQQEEILSESEKKDFDANAADKAAAEQNKIAKDVAAIKAMTPSSPELKAALDKAQLAAEKAAEKLFEQKTPEAQAEAKKAIESLQVAAKEAQKATQEAQKAQLAQNSPPL
ncbi:MAG: hypothetical protein WCI09_11995, partial [Planctomycetota bacterium]